MKIKISKLLNNIKSRDYSFFIVFLSIFLIFFMRSPFRLLQAQFWAEDGTVAFMDAYNKGFIPNLFSPVAGYLAIVMRLIAKIPIIFENYSSAPIFYALCSFIIASLIIAIFTTSLYDKLIPNKYVRIVLALSIAAGGSYFELMGSLANLQWYLGLIILHLCVWFIYHPGKSFSRLKSIAFCLFILLVCLSTPQVVCYAPFLLIFIVINFKKFSKTNIAVLITFFLGCGIQVVINRLFPADAYVTMGDHNYNFLNVFDVFYYKQLVQILIPKNFGEYLIQNSNYFLLAVFIIFFIVIYFFYSIKNKQYSFLFLVVSFLFINVGLLAYGRPNIIAISYSFKDLFVSSGGRYFFVPFVLLLIIGFSNFSLNKYKLLILPFLFIQVTAGLMFFQNEIVFTDLKWSDAVVQLQAAKKGEVVPVTVNPVWYAGKFQILLNKK